MYITDPPEYCIHIQPWEKKVIDPKLKGRKVTKSEIELMLTHNSSKLLKREMFCGRGPSSPLACISLQWFKNVWKQKVEDNFKICFTWNRAYALWKFSNKQKSYNLSSRFQFCIKSGNLPLKLLSFILLHITWQNSTKYIDKNISNM